MDFSTISSFVNLLASGGPQAIMAMLVVAIAGLLFDRRRLLGEIAKQDEKIDKVVDEYYKGNMTLSEALTSLKTVLFEIKAKI